MMGFSYMKTVYEHTRYLHGREKYYYCAWRSGASPTRKSTSQVEKYVIKKWLKIWVDLLRCRDETGCSIFAKKENSFSPCYLVHFLFQI